jgi:hypothetical protein
MAGGQRVIYETVTRHGCQKEAVNVRKLEESTSQTPTDLPASTIGARDAHDSIEVLPTWNDS